MKFRKVAFSLIELLISLIILSLLLAAFVPLISKKLKANDITVGSFGKGGSGGSLATLTRNVTKEDCDKYNALYISAAMNDGIKPICVTKWNVGDNVGAGGVPIAGDVQKLNAGSTCTDSGNCCWKGKTAADGSTTDGNYPGSNRTVCQWKAANTSCNNYSPKGTTAGMWRLPKKEEMEGWAVYIKEVNNDKGSDGLQLCDSGSADTIPIRCWGFAGGCPGTPDNHCYPYHPWGQTEISTGVYYSPNLSGGTLVSNKGSGNSAFSARCVLDSMVDTINTNEEDIEKDKHLEGEPQSQKDCDKLAPNLMFIDKAYNGTLGKNTCVTKYNIGDSGGPHLANIVDKTDVNNYCDGGYCCWVGKTSNECSNTGNGNSTYSGCNRTVCQWKAANATCALWAPDGRQGYWRLPSKTELDGWGGNLNKVSQNMGKDGLQLCDYSSTTSGSIRCDSLENGCLGSANGYCYPDHIWSHTKQPSGLYNDYYLGGGVFTPLDDIYSHTFSARCVYDGDYHYQNIQKETSGKAAYRQPYSQKDCDPFNALFIPAKYNGAGGVNLCVTKYNAFDNGGPQVTNAAALGIAIVNAGTSCPISVHGACCFQGITTGLAGSGCTINYSTYAGCYRATCQWYAANSICYNWTPKHSVLGSWRLPTKAEVEGWSAHLDILQFTGNYGLQLCDEASQDKGSNYCAPSSNCVSAHNSSCFASNIWTSDVATADSHYSYFLNSGNNLPAASNNLYGISVRCVTPHVPVE